VSKHFLLHTFGSLGDLHPFIALGLGLQARGHQASIATSEAYRTRVQHAGLGFYSVRPNFDPNDPALLAKVMDAKTGTQYVFKELTLPYLRETYADLTQAVKEADVLISSILTLAAPIVAEKTGVPWISCVLAPVSFFSAYDPSVINTPLSKWISGQGPSLNRWFFNMGKVFTNPWAKPLYDFRLELGLAKGQSPFFEAQHSPRCALALFSKHFAVPQKDWPKNSHATGFLFYDGVEKDLDVGLEHFLQSGDPPVVFTLGSSAVYTAGNFYVESLEAIKKLGCRAVLLVGKKGKEKFLGLPNTVYVADYAPYSKLFSRSSVVVHQGGIGTTAQSLRAGNPALIMPFAHDQFDNGLRIKGLGVGLTMSKSKYKSRQVAENLEYLLKDTTMLTKAKALGDLIRKENSVENAVDVIEKTVN
jgi:rhamnosyltransferase subunit B